MGNETKTFDRDRIHERLERYRNLAEISTDWFWETDENFVITYMSNSVERITGFPREKYIGVSRYDLASEETKESPDWQRHIEQVARHEPIKNFEYRHVGSDGYSVYLRVNAIPLFNSDGTFRGYSGSTSDISELVLARMRAEEMNRILEAQSAELKKAKEHAEYLARTDALTGLNNRRAFLEHGKAVDDLAQRYQRQYAVMMLDIDHFKTVNDTHGHAVGDITLKAVAEVIHKFIRVSDISGRLGGEEFAIILPETAPDSARVLAERLRQDIEVLRIPLTEGCVAITVSIGVAGCQVEKPSFETVLGQADASLYTAKKEGRNKVVAFVSSGAVD